MASATRPRRLPALAAALALVAAPAAVRAQVAPAKPAPAKPAPAAPAAAKPAPTAPANGASVAGKPAPGGPAPGAPAPAKPAPGAPAKPAPGKPAPGAAAPGAAPAAPASASAAAEARFVEGERLLAAGKTAEACAAFEASNQLEPRAGTLINLGLCLEKLGKLASALAAHRAALERVKDPKKRKLAADRAAALEPRVSQLSISLAPGARVPGLAVTRDGSAVDDAALERAVPVDGGSYRIAATAPGRAPWSATVEVAPEGARAAVTVPALAPLPATPDPAAAPLASAERAPGAPSAITGRRKLALGLGIAGLGLAAGGAALGVSARGLEDDAFALCPDPAAPCDDAARANDLLDRGNQRALLANVAYAAGGAALAGAIVLWLTGGPDRGGRDRISVTPRAGGPGVDVLVRF